MSTQPIIAVLGATGAQGGGLVRAILGDQPRRFAVRAITRKTDSPVARELAALGAEVRFGDSDDAESLERAFDGAHGVYAMTNFWEHFSPSRELAQAAVIARAARKANVKHVIWSTLEDTRLRVPLSDNHMPTLMEHYKVPHLDAKGEANALFRDLPTTLLHTSFYWDNFIHFGMGPRRAADGTLELVLPMGDRKLPGIAAADIGTCAYGVFKRGAVFVNRSVGIAGEHLTGSEMAAAFAEALREPVRYVPIPFRAYAQLGFPGADDLANMFQYKHDFNEEFCGARPIPFSRALNPKLQSFREWLALNAAAIPNIRLQHSA